MSAHYTPATDSGVAVVSGGRAVLVTANRAGRAAELLDAIDRPDAVAALLELLLRDGLTAMPDFGYLELDGSTARLIVRGAVTAEVSGDRFEGTDYSTWGEHRATGAERISLSMMTSADGPALPLPLHRGAAFASSVTLEEGSAASVVDEGPAAQSAPSAPVTAPPAPADRPEPDADVADSSDAGAPAPLSAPPVQPAEPNVSAPPQLIVPPAPPPAPEAAPGAFPEQTIVEYTMADPEAGYGHLFEETIVRPVEHAAVRDDVEESDGAPTDATSGDDAASSSDGYEEHDGLTIMSGDLAKLRADASPGTATPSAETPTVAMPEQQGAELRFSNGMVESLSGLMIIGRSPSSGKVSAGRVPRLVTIADDPDLSRSHVQVELQGGAVVVTDLHSRNGTSIALPGRTAERLRGGVPTTVIHGTVIDLGGGLTIQVYEGEER